MFKTGVGAVTATLTAGLSPLSVGVGPMPKAWPGFGRFGAKPLNEIGAIAILAWVPDPCAVCKGYDRPRQRLSHYHASLAGNRLRGRFLMAEARGKAGIGIESGSLIGILKTAFSARAIGAFAKFPDQFRPEARLAHRIAM